jgi:SET domain-containing protein
MARPAGAFAGIAAPAPLGVFGDNPPADRRHPRAPRVSGTEAQVKTKRLPRMEIRKSKYGGFGLFAAEAIEGGSRIIDYIGEKLDMREAKRRERFYDSIGYQPLFDVGPDLTIDGLVGGNESRFINHSARRANVEAAIERGKVWFYANRDIDAGEELLLDYGFDPRARSRSR